MYVLACIALFHNADFRHVQDTVTLRGTLRVFYGYKDCLSSLFRMSYKALTAHCQAFHDFFFI